MPDILAQQPIEQQAPPIPGFRLNSRKLVARMEALKKEPTEGMRTFMQAHPEYKEYNCAFLAAYCGLSESTLKKLKQGQIADPRASTFWMLWHAYRIYPRDILDMPPEHVQESAGSIQSADIKGKDERISELKQAPDASEAHRQSLHEKLLNESIARSAAETEAKHRKRALTVLGGVTAVLLLVLIYLLIDATHTSWGIFRQ